MRSTLATVVSSSSISIGQPIPPEVWLLFSEILDLNIASIRLKLGSLLYCYGEMHGAAQVLDNVHGRFDSSIQSICGCKRQLRHEKISESFCQFCMNNEVNDIRRKVAACVKFTRQEMFCVPPFLWFEMYRGAGDDIDHRHNSERVWMD